MIRTIEFVPEDFDPQFYMDSYGGEYADQFEEMYWEDVAYELDRAQDVATDVALAVNDDETGLPPAFHTITIRHEEVYPYGGYPKGGIIVEIECPDGPDELDDLWRRFSMDRYGAEPDFRDTRGRRNRLLARYDAEARKIDDFVTVLEENGFVEDVSARNRGTSKMPMNAGRNYAAGETFKAPASWPSRSRRPAGKVSGAKAKESSKPRSKGARR